MYFWSSVQAGLRFLTIHETRVSTEARQVRRSRRDVGFVSCTFFTSHQNIRGRAVQSDSGSLHSVSCSVPDHTGNEAGVSSSLFSFPCQSLFHHCFMDICHLFLWPAVDLNRQHVITYPVFNLVSTTVTCNQSEHRVEFFFLSFLGWGKTGSNWYVGHSLAYWTIPGW
jgi:hypothetical protein